MWTDGDWELPCISFFTLLDFVLSSSQVSIVDGGGCQPNLVLSPVLNRSAWSEFETLYNSKPEVSLFKIG